MANAIPSALAMDNTAFRPVDILRSMIGGIVARRTMPG